MKSIIEGRLKPNKLLGLVVSRKKDFFMKKIILSIITICILQSGCNSSSLQSEKNTKPLSTNKVFLVGHQLVDCEGVAKRKCMVVNGELFYNTIEGFVYEEGYHYILDVKEVHTIEDEVPAGGSSISYQLLKQVKKVAVNS